MHDSLAFTLSLLVLTAGCAATRSSGTVEAPAESTSSQDEAVDGDGLGGPSSAEEQLEEDQGAKQPAFRFDGIQRGLAPYAGLVGPIFSDPGWQLTNLYWSQRMNAGRLNFVAGVVDSTDYLNLYGLVNPWTAFSNLTFLTDATIPAPNQGLGAAVGAMLGERTYVLAGVADVADANGDPTEPEDSFFDDAEYFSHLELGWIPS